MEQRHVGACLKSLSNLIMRRAHRGSLDEITAHNVWILCYLSEHPGEDVFQRDLEKAFDVTRSTTSKVIMLMERKGLIERRRVSGDARLKKLCLTPKAVEALSAFRAEMTRLENTLTRGFTAEEIDTFLNCVDRMKKNLNDQEAQA